MVVARQPVEIKNIHLGLKISARTVYWRTQARGKRKHITRFDIRYFFLEVGLSLSGLTQPHLLF